jgi:hypothetical protein
MSSFGYSQKQSADIDSISGVFFYNLQLDSIRSVVIESALNNSKYNFTKKEAFSFVPILELENNNGGLLGSDSTSIVFQYNNPMMISHSHGKPEHSTLFSQSIEIWTEFSDSLQALNAYLSLTDNLKGFDYDSSFHQNSFEIDNQIAGKYAQIKLGKNKDKNTLNSYITITFDHRKSYNRNYIIRIEYKRETVEKEKI